MLTDGPHLQARTIRTGSGLSDWIEEAVPRNRNSRNVSRGCLESRDFGSILKGFRTL